MTTVSKAIGLGVTILTGFNSLGFAMPQDLLADVLDYIKKTDEQEKELNHISAKELQAEQNQLAQKLKISSFANRRSKAA